MAKWVCLSDNGWVSYSEEDSGKIEAALNSDARYIDLNFNGNTYRIDFSTMNQTNRGTAVSRSVQRISSAVSFFNLMRYLHIVRKFTNFLAGRRMAL
jgi:hypothetical protein